MKDDILVARPLFDVIAVLGLGPLLSGSPSRLLYRRPPPRFVISVFFNVTPAKPEIHEGIATIASLTQGGVFGRRAHCSVCRFAPGMTVPVGVETPTGQVRAWTN